MIRGMIGYNYRYTILTHFKMNMNEHACINKTYGKMDDNLYVSLSMEH